MNKAMMKVLTERGYGKFKMKRVRPEQPQKVLTSEQEEKRRIAKEKRRIRREREEREARARYRERRLLFKPCPFCGGKDAEILYPGDVNAFVQCPKCNATGPGIQSGESVGDTDSEAIARWNKRA